MKKIKLLFFIFGICVLVACSKGNNTVDNSENKNLPDLTVVVDGNLLEYDELLEKLNSDDRITKDTHYCVIFRINDDNVKDNEILLDLYSIDEKREIGYFGSKYGENDMKYFESGTLNHILTEEDTYVFQTKGWSNDIENYSFSSDYMRLGNHYVVTFEKIGYILEKYK